MVNEMIHNSKLAGLRLLAFFLFILPAIGNGESGLASLSIYVDDDFGKALVVGYIDDPESLPFPMASGQIYEKETGMLYAVTDSLIYAQGSAYRLEFPLKGSFDECHAVFYIPGNVDMKEIDCSQGMDFLSSSYNGSLVLDVHGFDLTDPTVEISYQPA
jgi:hypothetical protein